MPVRGRSIVAAGALAAAACAIPSYREFSAGDAPRSDAGGADTAPPMTLDDGAVVTPVGDAEIVTDGAATIDAGARVNLIEGNGATFDNGSCVGTSKPEYNVGGYRASLEGVPIARTGAGSCRVCRNVGNGFFTIDTNFLAPVPVGTYHARAWVRLPSDVPQAFPVLIFLRTMKGDYTEIQSRASKELILTAQWQSLEITFDVTSPVPRMDTFLGGEPSNTASPACFLVDDYEVWRD